MILENDELAQAVYFFDDELITKEMHYAEFEAILDGFVPAVEMSGMQCKAVFVEIDSQFNINTAVFFLVTFNSNGQIESSWDLPLQQVAKTAMRGPDMGSGRIRLACKSQCPIQYFKELLWDPDLRTGKGHLNTIKKSAVLNKLAIQFKIPEEELSMLDEPVRSSSESLEIKIAKDLRQQYAKEFRDHMSQILKDERLRAATAQQQKEDVIQQLKRRHAKRLEELRGFLEEKERIIEEERNRNQSLKETIDGQAKKIEGLREYFELKLEQAEGQERDVIQELRRNFELEMEAKIEASVKEYKERLQMREVELHYRNEQETQFKDEIARLRRQNQQLMDNSGDHLLEKMMAKGVSFVTFQPGAGHITIPLNEVSRFMENPMAYAAEQCGVKESHYMSWLKHYQAPVCTATDGNDHICGENIERCDVPSDFLMGDGGPL